MAMSANPARQEIVDFARKLATSGLSPGRSGNISVRNDNGMLITPSALAYDKMKPGDIVQLDESGNRASGQRRPSSEWPLHAAIYRSFADAAAVIHSHSKFATTLACLGRSIPAFHYMVAMAGGNSIRCSEYATFGSDRLAELAVQALQDRKACLLGNHGQIAWHTSLVTAYELAWEVENLSSLYWNTLQIAEPNLLDDDEMETVLEKFRDYRSN
jgi:L-fuculose-phosphate aldolase